MWVIVDFYRQKITALAVLVVTVCASNEKNYHSGWPANG
jgi:hypothetical protein